MDEYQEKLFQLLSEMITDDQTEIIVYSGTLNKPYDEELIKDYYGKKKSRVLLLLATYGGSADSAYRIARCFREHFDSFSVFIHTTCKSAGTLLALGANEMIISDHAEIGPLDVQIRKTDELGELSSGLTITQALVSLQTQAFNMFEEYFLSLRAKSGHQIATVTAMNIAAQLTVGLFAPIYSQIDPTRIGEDQRAIMVSMEYGERIGKDNLKDNALEKLVTGYPDHGFVIDRTECKELFKNVRCPNEKEKKIADHLLPIINENISKRLPFIYNLTEWYLKEKEKKEVTENEQGNNTEDREDKTGKSTEECPDNKEVDAKPNDDDDFSETT